MYFINMRQKMSQNYFYLKDVAVGSCHNVGGKLSWWESVEWKNVRMRNWLSEKKFGWDCFWVGKYLSEKLSLCEIVQLYFNKWNILEWESVLVGWCWVGRRKTYIKNLQEKTIISHVNFKSKNRIPFRREISINNVPYRKKTYSAKTLVANFGLTVP